MTAFASSSTPPLRLAVIGTGAFGRNHLRVYRELETAHPGTIQLAAFVEPNSPLREQIKNAYSIPGFSSLDELLAANLAANAASVCVPTVHHAEVAAQLLRAGLDLLIEKPFASTLSEADRLLELATAHSRIVQVGHLERFNPAVTAARERITEPMFFEAHRLSVFTPRSLDVDVVLDLMIHDLDIVLSLTQSPVTEVRAVGLPVLSDKVDIANVRIEFRSGCVANFTASRVSTERVRKIRLFQPHEYLSLDFARQELLTIKVDPAVLSTLNKPISASPMEESSISTPLAPKHSSLDHPSAGLSLNKLDLPYAEPLRLEIEDFLIAVRNRTPPRVSGDAGRAALALALEVNQQIARHAHRTGLS